MEWFTSTSLSLMQITVTNDIPYVSYNPISVMYHKIDLVPNAILFNVILIYIVKVYNNTKVIHKVPILCVCTCKAYKISFNVCSQSLASFSTCN